MLREKEVTDKKDITEKIIKVAFIIQIIAIVVIALFIAILTIKTQIENDKKFDRLLENQFILQERLEFLEGVRNEK